MESCHILNKKFRQCIGEWGTNHKKCNPIEQKLRQCSTNLKFNGCIDQVIQLVNCVKKPDTSLCAEQFLNMRECNRPSGSHLSIDKEKQITIYSTLKKSLNDSVKLPLVEKRISV
ncbi:uncharacterized protein LOC128884418 [Hylaeus volcanicus]|uniref:uncharacterized protein LOC128884418 n=1 Tax=Hylaeus volcanicus TaxID=313075 RepID=UPI0023B87683|nr:uncharacterized protein LOC128884418 [Hylaeus volcanicus]